MYDFAFNNYVDVQLAKAAYATRVRAAARPPFTGTDEQQLACSVGAGKGQSNL